jgi:hypothetical protein
MKHFTISIPLLLLVTAAASGQTFGGTLVGETPDIYLFDTGVAGQYEATVMWEDSDVIVRSGSASESSVRGSAVSALAYSRVCSPIIHSTSKLLLLESPAMRSRECLLRRFLHGYGANWLRKLKPYKSFARLSHTEI